MELDEITISRAIIDSHLAVLRKHLRTDVAVVGAGPAGLTCAAILAGCGIRVTVIEKKLSVGGGIWGGGMMFPRIVVQDEAVPLLDKFGIRHHEYEPGYHVAGSIEAVAKLTAAACDGGVEFLNLTTVEDVMVRGDGRLGGLVINWTPVDMAGLHVDPLTLSCRYAVDATGHDAVLARLVAARGADLTVHGESYMWADRAESTVVENTREIYPGLVAAGMAANAVAGGHRMGPIFGGMFRSGARAAELIIEALSA
ncbi:MAG: sulfide-dependent adenosine diphosphate thiazole synthase [Methanoculleaceae archaeon]